MGCVAIGSGQGRGNPLIRLREGQSCVPQPILARKALDPTKFPLVVSDDRIAEGDGLGGSKQIVSADRPADLLKPGSDQFVSGVCWGLEGDNIKCAQYRFKLSR